MNEVDNEDVYGAQQPASIPPTLLSPHSPLHPHCHVPHTELSNAFEGLELDSDCKAMLVACFR